ncbi:MAG: hypothetical protein ABFD64_08415 [Armatimonadota bacterium]
MIENPFSYNKYLVCKQFMKLFGATLRFYAPSNQSLALFVSMKAFKLKEDIRVYTDEQKLHEVLAIKARSIIDISSVYDVWDPAKNEKVGALKRRGFKSMIKDEWVIMDQYDREIGLITEDSLLLALLRRFVTRLIPQKFHGEIGDRHVFTLEQHFNPIITKMDVDFTPDIMQTLDRRLGIAATVLMCCIEGRQGGY